MINLARLAAICFGFWIGLCRVAIARHEPLLVRVPDMVTFPLPLWVVMHEDLAANVCYGMVFDALATAIHAAA